MATARAHLSVVASNIEMVESWDALIERYGQAFITIEARADATSWERAQLVKAFDDDTKQHPDMRGEAPHEISRVANRDLRNWLAAQRKPHVGPNFMANARKVFATWGDIRVDPNILPYDAYRRLATCSLPLDQKEELRVWAEDTQPTQAELRQRIRQDVDATRGVYRPDFELKLSNHWVFQVEKRTDGFDGGVNRIVYANLIHHFSDPGDTIIDPCAGGGLLAQTLTHYRHFREHTQAEHSGPRYALMCDIAPSRPDILMADARQGLPFAPECATLAILDPPYFKMAEGKYATLGATIEQWLADIRVLLRATSRCLVPNGRLAIMTDDYLTKDYHEPLGHRILLLLLEEGWEPVTTIYDFNRNFLAMPPPAMARFKRARLHVNALKTIQVALRPA